MEAVDAHVQRALEVRRTLELLVEQRRAAAGRSFLCFLAAQSKNFAFFFLLEIIAAPARRSTTSMTCPRINYNERSI